MGKDILSTWNLSLIIQKKVRLKDLQLHDWQLTNGSTYRVLELSTKCVTFCDACFSHFWQLHQELHQGDQWKAHRFYSSFEWAPKSMVLMKFKDFVYPLPPPGYAQRHSDIKTDWGSVSQSNTSKRNPLGKQGSLTSPSAQAVEQDRVENKFS